MRGSIRTLLLLAGGAFTLTLPLAGRAEFNYALGSELGYMYLKVGDEDFHPLLASLYVDARHDSGLGVELLAATGIADDDAARVEMDLSSHLAGFVTYSFASAGLTTMFGAGYADTSLDASLRGGDYPGKTDFEGGAFFLRFSEGFKRWPEWELSMGLSSLFNDGDVEMWSANLGLRYVF